MTKDSLSDQSSKSGKLLGSSVANQRQNCEKNNKLVVINSTEKHPVIFFVEFQ